MLRVVNAAGYPLPAGDDGRLRVQLDSGIGFPPGLPQHYVVVHPGASAPARTCSPPTWRALVETVRQAGHRVVLTGDERDAELVHQLVLDGECFDTAGRFSMAELALVLTRAHAVIIGNTGPAHLAAAVGTPIVSLFSPVVSAAHWAPFTERLALLGRVDSDCARTRARVCPVPGHPCLDSVTGSEVLAALDRLGVQAPGALR
jgi:ADP-heptose:LPS heptosyltransferase